MCAGGEKKERVEIKGRESERDDNEDRVRQTRTTTTTSRTPTSSALDDLHALVARLGAGHRRVEEPVDSLHRAAGLGRDALVAQQTGH